MKKGRPAYSLWLTVALCAVPRGATRAGHLLAGLENLTASCERAFDLDLDLPVLIGSQLSWQLGNLPLRAARGLTQEPLVLPSTTTNLARCLAESLVCSLSRLLDVSLSVSCVWRLCCYYR
jgi:hypothetical protein